MRRTNRGGEERRGEEEEEEEEEEKKRSQAKRYGTMTMSMNSSKIWYGSLVWLLSCLKPRVC